MAGRLKKTRSSNNALKIPIAFLNHYLPIVNGDYLKIYLFGLKLCMENIQLSDEEIAKKLNFLKADVTNAWKYWESEGVICILDDQSIEFVDPVDISFNKNNVSKKAANEENFEDIFDLVRKDEKFKESIRTVESFRNELLTQNDVLLLYDIVETQKIPLELFLITMTHCTNKDKKSIPYISKVVTECYKKGYKTEESLGTYFSKEQESHETAGRIKKILKIYNRELSDREKDYIIKWEVSNKSDDEIKDAYEKTILNTGKLSFPYLDKILMNENGNNVSFKTSVKVGPLNNFTQPLPDFQIITEDLIKSQKM